MRRSRICVFVASVLVMIMIFSTLSFAAEQPMEIGNVTIVDGRLSNEGMMGAIEEYLYSKTLEPVKLSTEYLAQSNVRTAESDVFKTEVINRNNAFKNLEAKFDVPFKAVDIASQIMEIVEQNNRTVVVKVYETTMIEYYAAVGLAVSDIMGYGTDHLITLEMIDGEYQVVADSYDERLITGACSADLIGKLAVSDVTVNENVNLSEMDVNNVVYPRSVINYNVNAAINYANQYCGFDLSNHSYAEPLNQPSNSTGNPYYNQAYEDFNDVGGDCANFVSQCLLAGGLFTTGNWVAYEDQWINAKCLHASFTVRGFNPTSATTSNVYPGNPVYWWNGTEFESDASPSGHQMICTGYNSAGIPVVNGHNPDMFRYPITEIDPGTSGLKTAFIVTSDQHTHDALGVSFIITPTHHSPKCKHCQSALGYSEHTFVTSGTSRYCSGCGYTVN